MILEYLEKCTRDGFYIAKVEDQTQELCTAACTQNGCSLQWVDDVFITDELIKICMETDNHVMLRLRCMYIEISEDVMLYACERNGMDLQYCYNPSMDLCRVACGSNGISLNFVPREYKDIEICTIACVQDPRAIYYVPEELVTSDMLDMYSNM